MSWPSSFSKKARRLSLSVLCWENKFTSFFKLAHLRCLATFYVQAFQIYDMCYYFYIFLYYIKILIYILLIFLYFYILSSYIILSQQLGYEIYRKYFLFSHFPIHKTHSVIFRLNVIHEFCSTEHSSIQNLQLDWWSVEKTMLA